MTLRYPPRTMIPDLARAVVGIVVCATPAVVGEFHWILRLVLLALAGLFVAYAAQALTRRATRVELGDEGLRLGPGDRPLAWSDLSRFALAYFSVRRDGREGWMELRLAAGETQLRVDSRLEGFEELVRHAFDAARQRGLPMDPATVHNLSALGLVREVPSEPAP
ncbi:MAG: hypothetical protein H6982_08605 [Chromatiales bacterium]|nr:hypothetical protein [Chromatiales bacterium]